MNAIECVKKARSSERPNVKHFVERIFDEFHPCFGDRLMGNDEAIIGGGAYFKGQPVTIVGHHRGRSTEENIACRFGMPIPSGYHKAQRLMAQAEKFRRPIITFIDTPGAYPGVEAEAFGQGAVIAKSIMHMSQLKVPVLALVIGEGGSGGALALAMADEIWMLEHSVFSVVSPEGCASILWKDTTRVDEAAQALQLTAQDLQKLGICEKIFTERFGFEGSMGVYQQLEESIEIFLRKSAKQSSEDRLNKRYQKFRKVGTVHDNSIRS